MDDQPLSREQMISVIEGRGAAPRVPVMLHFWTRPRQFGDRAPAVQALLDRYPHDAQTIGLRVPQLFTAPPDAPSYRWANMDDPYAGRAVGHDARVALADWGQLDALLADWPDAQYAGLTADNPPADGRYRLGSWTRLLFERHWELRGMEDALMDPHTNPRELHRLLEAMADFYLVALERGREELRLDGVLTTDDLGTQTGPFFSPATFDEFYAPYYRRLIDKAHALGMHFWLHTCGDVGALLGRFVSLGLDVIHPIQKYCMDERQVARQFGDRLTVWAGFDVQQIIPWGTPEQVRAEVRHLMDTYWRPEGRFLFTAGNAINGDCPLPSLEALYDEAFRYGRDVCR